MARAPMKLHLEKNQLHKDVGKTPGAKITEPVVYLPPKDFSR